jgi:hypothetical protein
VVRTRDSEPLLHTHFVEHIAADLGFILLSNGDFRASRNHGDTCADGCGFMRNVPNDLKPTRDDVAGRSLFQFIQPPPGPGPHFLGRGDIKPRRL